MAGIDLTKVKREVVKGLKRVEELKNARSETGDEIAAIRSRMVMLGVPKRAFDQALAYKAMDEDKRRGLDAGYTLAREAIGLPFDAQGELFIPTEEEAEEQADIEE